MDSFAPWIFAGIPIVALAVVVFFIIAIIQEGKRVQGAIRWAYFYAISLIGLAIIVGSTAFLLNQLAVSTVFPKGDVQNDFRGIPPTLFLERSAVGDETIAKPIAVGATTLSCTTDCAVTDIQRQEIDAWKASYQSWKETTVPGTRGQNIVNALSFLLVALPLYLLHYLWIQRKRRSEAHSPSTLNATYLYTVSIAGLLMVVISGALLINLGLKTVFLSDTAQKTSGGAPITIEPNAVQSLIDCNGKCAGLTAEDVQIAQEWKVDYDTYQASQNSLSTQRQRDLANNLPLLLVGIPLFWFHFASARRDSGKMESAPPTTIA